MATPRKPTQPEGPPTDRQIALFIAEMCGELRLQAHRPRFRTVNYLLDMTRLEAERMARDLPD